MSAYPRQDRTVQPMLLGQVDLIVRAHGYETYGVCRCGTDLQAQPGDYKAAWRDHLSEEIARFVENHQELAEKRGAKAMAEKVEPILSLLHHRGLVDSPENRLDVSNALSAVRGAGAWS